jgi:transposase-like protein
MTFHVFLFLLLSFLMLCPAWLCRLSLLHPGLLRSKAGIEHPVVRRLLKPRTPRDCPACCHSSTFSTGPSPVQPWCEVKSRRGAPKRIDTQGFACPNQQCPYHGITDAHVHALVGDGKHGHAELIQTFRCQACRTTFSARRHTPLYRLKTPSHHIAMVLTALAEGLDASAAERVFGYRVLPWEMVDKSISPFQAPFELVFSSSDRPDRPSHPDVRPHLTSPAGAFIHLPTI